VEIWSDACGARRLKPLRLPRAQMEVHVHLKNTFPGGMETEGSNRATIFGVSSNPSTRFEFEFSYFETLLILHPNFEITKELYNPRLLSSPPLHHNKIQFCGQRRIVQYIILALPGKTHSQDQCGIKGDKRVM